MFDPCCPKTPSPFGIDLETGQRMLRPMNAQVGLVASQDRRKWVAIVAVGLSLFLSALDATIVALALPPIASRFQLSQRSSSRSSDLCLGVLHVVWHQTSSSC